MTMDGSGGRNFHHFQFRQLADFACGDNYKLLAMMTASLICWTAIIAAADRPPVHYYACWSSCLCVVVVFAWGLFGVVRNGLLSYEIGRRIIHAFCTATPLLHAILTAIHMTQFDCGGTCDPTVWTAVLQRMLIMPIVIGTVVHLPFSYLFWSSSAIWVVLPIAWNHLAQMSGGPKWTDIFEMLPIAAVLLYTAWQQEALSRKIFILSHKESTTILGSVSHDLRTPLVVIRSIIHYLRSMALNESKLGDPQIDAELAKADDGCKRIDGLVEDLLLASTMYNTDCKELVMKQDIVNLFEFMDQHINHVRFKLQKSVTLDLKIDDLVPNKIRIDEKRLSQMVTNLLTNAAKFTQAGSIKLTCVLLRASAVGEHAPITLKVCVEDTGVGIDKEGVKKLRKFQLFNKLGGIQNILLNPSGTGIGLSICHALVRKLGGVLDFKSTPGVGSAFWFTVEAGTAGVVGNVEEEISQKHIAHDPVLSGESESSTRLLLVDDDSSVRCAVKMLLLKTAIETTEATNGVEALALVESEEFDCILMDCGMPHMDGFECTRKIRTLETGRGRTRTHIIGHTANSDKKHAIACAAAGMDLVVPKGGTQRSLLVQMIRSSKDNSIQPRLLSSVSSDPTTNEESGSDDQTFKVMVFDDSPFDGEAIMMLCEGCRYTVDVVTTEDEAMKTLAKKKFDLILVDYHQPAPFDCVKFVERLYNRTTAKVAMISADDTVEQVYRFLRLPHLVGFLPKVSCLATLSSSLLTLLPSLQPLTYSNVQRLPHLTKAEGNALRETEVCSQ
jgi:signal transduction histidine kinase/DNA-binding response OmpR family regulator